MLGSSQQYGSQKSCSEVEEIGETCDIKVGAIVEQLHRKLTTASNFETKTLVSLLRKFLGMFVFCPVPNAPFTARKRILFKSDKSTVKLKSTQKKDLYHADNMVIFFRLFLERLATEVNWRQNIDNTNSLRLYQPYKILIVVKFAHPEISSSPEQYKSRCFRRLL